MKLTNIFYLRVLDKHVSPAETTHQPSATLIDGMSLVRKMNGNDKTFSQLAESVLAKVIHEGGQSKCTDDIFDVQKNMFGESRFMYSA